MTSRKNWNKMKRRDLKKGMVVVMAQDFKFFRQSSTFTNFKGQTKIKITNYHNPVKEVRVTAVESDKFFWGEFVDCESQGRFRFKITNINEYLSKYISLRDR